MLNHGMMFEVIDWSEDQATLPGLYPATSKQRWRALRRRGLPGTWRPANPRRTAFFACQVGAECGNKPKRTSYISESSKGIGFPKGVWRCGRALLSF